VFFCAIVVQTSKGSKMIEMKTRLSVPTEAFVRKFAEHRKVSLSVAIDQILSHVVKSGGIEIKDKVEADTQPLAEDRVREARDKYDATVKVGDDDPAI
jgi:hypothetical protein